QVHQAGASIAKDVASADNITAGSAGNWACSILCYQWNPATLTFTTSTVNYTINNGNLLRNGVYVAQYIDAAHTSFVKGPATVTENNTYVLTVTAVKSLGLNKNATFSNSFKMYQRLP
ncbi:MAG: hypothetical protein ACYDHZ_06870, partial [Dehalococcoidia bacterium]